MPGEIALTIEFIFRAKNVTESIYIYDFQV